MIRDQLMIHDSLFIDVHCVLSLLLQLTPMVQRPCIWLRLVEVGQLGSKALPAAARKQTCYDLFAKTGYSTQYSKDNQ